MQLLNYMEKKSSILSQIKPYLILVRNPILNKYEKSRSEEVIQVNKDAYEKALKLLIELKGTVEGKLTELLEEQLRSKLEQNALSNLETEKANFRNESLNEGEVLDYDQFLKNEPALLSKKRGRK